MKKILLLVLLCFTLCACSAEKAPTKEEMLSVAVEVSASDIQNDSIENIASAKEKYCNKTLLLSGMVYKINENYIELAQSYMTNYIVDVYLSVEEIATLKAGQAISVVGTTTEEIKDVTESVMGTSFSYGHYQMTNSYIVKDTIELKGILKGVNNSYAPAFNIQIGNSNVYRLIYFADNVDASTLTFGKEIKFSAKSVNGNGMWSYYDAEIIE